MDEPELGELFLPVQKLSKDLKVAASRLGDTEARFLVDAYYVMQDQRVRTNNRVSSLERAGNIEPHAVLDWLLGQSETLESQVKLALFAYAKSRDLGQWMLSVYGIGPVISAGLLAHVDWTKPTVGHVWRYAGLDPSCKWEKGEKRPWNASLKKLCVHPDSKVATRRGYLPISQVVVGDEVLTHKGRWRRVNQVFQNSYEGSIYRFSAANAGNMGGWFTEGHPIYTAPVKTWQSGRTHKPNELTRQPFGWHAVESLKPRWRVMRPVFSGDGWPEPRPLLMEGVELEGNLVAAKGRWAGVPAPRSKLVPKEVKLTREFMRLVGLYLSEGHVTKNSVGWSFHQEEEELQLFVKEQLLEITGGAACFFENGLDNSYQVMVNMKPLADFFAENFGFGSLDARFPMEWFGLDHSFLESLWQGLLEGDGDHQGTYENKRFTTTSETLAYQVLELGRLLGKSVAMHREKERDGIATPFRIHENQRPDTTPSVGKVVQVYYQGPVFNLEVEEDHSYVVEGFAVHNCWKIGESFIKFQNQPKDIYGKQFALRKQFEIANNDSGRLADQARVGAERVKKNTESWPWYAGCYPGGTTAAYFGLASVFPEVAKCNTERARLLKDRKLKPGEGTPMLPPNHIKARARRYAVKLFLSHVHFVGHWMLTKRLAPSPYAIEFCGHAHFLPPPNMDQVVGLQQAWDERQRQIQNRPRQNP
jgi:hypothetical protein